MPNPTEQVDAVVEARELAKKVDSAFNIDADPRDVYLDDLVHDWHKAQSLLKTLADEVERREKLVALAVRWRAERLRYQTDPTVTNRAYGKAADALAMEIENYA